MALTYLEFDYSEDTEGVATFDAMASVGPAHLPGVLADIEQVLGWAFAHFAGSRGPLDEGMQWDFDVQSQREFTVADRVLYDEASGRIALEPGAHGQPRHTVTLSLSGTQAFGGAFRAAFLDGGDA
jgi:hypothetical protein